MSETFCLEEQFVRAAFGVSEIFWYGKTMRNGVSRFFIKSFLSYVTENIRRDLQCFREFRVSKNFMHKRLYHNFSSLYYCLKVCVDFGARIRTNCLRTRLSYPLCHTKN